MSPFEALTPFELYALLRLRSAVFVVEQACAFQDPDGLDQQAMHVQACVDGRLVACARCFGPGIAFAEASIGRVATDVSLRRAGIGHLLVERAIAEIGRCWGAQAIRIGAQTRLRRFYEQHGFQDLGRPYTEDGIAHLEMLRPSAIPGASDPLRGPSARPGAPDPLGLPSAGPGVLGPQRTAFPRSGWPAIAHTNEETRK